MTLLETSHFRKLRKKFADAGEKDPLKPAVLSVLKDPLRGKSLKGELSNFRSLRLSGRGQTRRLIYQFEKETITLVSFGPQGGVRKKQSDCS
jgi:mRNA-degrading endonuclease RelE of RelBE toxin-antitoxin system